MYCLNHLHVGMPQWNLTCVRLHVLYDMIEHDIQCECTVRNKVQIGSNFYEGTVLRRDC